MAARRLIFLLAAFLPPSYSTSAIASPGRPSTSTSFRGYSQSPPVHPQLSRPGSLRRSIRRRPKAEGSHESYPSVTFQENAGPTTESNTSRRGSTSSDAGSSGTRSRRPSEARSFIKANLAMTADSDACTRKSSATTTSTVTPNATVPVPHFAYQRPGASVAMYRRPGSSGALASVDLMKNLQRNESSAASTESQSGSRWGSLMSFWGGVRRESTDQSDITVSTDEGLGILGLPHARHLEQQSQNKLEQMVQEVGVDRELYQEDLEEPACSDQQAPELQAGNPQGTATPALQQRPHSVGSPIRLSVNEKDGVIDVDIPFPTLYVGSPSKSPTTMGFDSISSLGESAFGHTAPRRETDQALNVAGWLGKFHPDFSVLGVHPYDDLEKEIKRAMSTEPTPTQAIMTSGFDRGPTERWVDVCSSLVADTTNFTVKRIHLRRRVRLTPAPSPPAVTPGLHAAPLRTHFANPYANASAPSLPMNEQTLEQKFTEEMIMDIDSTLADAVDRVLAQSGNPSRAVSNTSSRSSSRQGRRGEERVGNDESMTSSTEVPKGECRQAILGALEQVVKSIAAERAAQAQAAAKAQKEGQAQAIEGAAALTANAGRHLGRESTLREGVRKWMSEVEKAR